MRIMGIDYGDARTGLAVSDAMNILVGEAWTVNQWDANVLADEIVKQAESRGIERFVLGLPKNMDGTEGARAEKCREFAALLGSKTDIPIVMWDERRSSVEAHAILHANGKKEKSTAKPSMRSRRALFLRATSGHYEHQKGAASQ